MNPLHAEPHREAESIHENLTLVNNLLWLAIDAFSAHHIEGFDHLKETLYFVNERVWEQINKAEQLQQVLYQRYVEQQRQVLRVQEVAA